MSLLLLVRKNVGRRSRRNAPHLMPLSLVALVPIALLLAAEPSDYGRQPSPDTVAIPPTVYCCDLDGNCVVAEDGQPCNAAELSDQQSNTNSQEQSTPMPGLRRTLTDRQLPDFDTNFRGEWGDFLRWLELNPAVPYIVEGTVVNAVGELGVLPDSPREVYLTRCTVEVSNTFKGTPDAFVTYHVLGGVIPGHGGMIAYHSPGCRVGDNLLLFLQDMGGIIMPAHGSYGSITLKTLEGITDPRNNAVREFYLNEVMK